MVDYGESSADVTWASSLALGANGAGEEGGSEDWILRRSTNPSTPADVSLPDPAYPLAGAGETIYVNTTGRPQVCYFLVERGPVVPVKPFPIFTSIRPRTPHAIQGNDRDEPGP